MSVPRQRPKSYSASAADQAKKRKVT
jgi:hypothetical protein